MQRKEKNEKKEKITRKNLLARQTCIRRTCEVSAGASKGHEA
jgi:hypothetical protein